MAAPVAVETTNAYSKRIILAHNTNASTTAAFADLVTFGLPDNWYAGYAANVRKVTAKDVKKVASTVIPSKNMVFSIVGDMSKVRAEVDKLNLGEAAMFDLYGMPLKQ